MRQHHRHDLLPDAPNLGTVRPWIGPRPLTPDGIPILGPTSYPNPFLNLGHDHGHGHGHPGWTMACGSGKLLADLLTRLTPDLAVITAAVIVGAGSPVDNLMQP